MSSGQWCRHARIRSTTSTTHCVGSRARALDAKFEFYQFAGCATTGIWRTGTGRGGIHSDDDDDRKPDRNTATTPTISSPCRQTSTNALSLSRVALRYGVGRDEHCLPALAPLVLWRYLLSRLAKDDESFSLTQDEMVAMKKWRSCREEVTGSSDVRLTSIFKAVGIWSSLPL